MELEEQCAVVGEAALHLAEEGPDVEPMLAHQYRAVFGWTRTQRKRPSVPRARGHQADEDAALRSDGQAGRLLDAEGAAAEACEADEADERSPLPEDVKVTCGHGRAKALQVRLKEDELAELAALTADRGPPVSTRARQLLLQALSPGDVISRVLLTGSSATSRRYVARRSAPDLFTGAIAWDLL